MGCLWSWGPQAALAAATSTGTPSSRLWRRPYLALHLPGLGDGGEITGGHHHGPGHRTPPISPEPLKAARTVNSSYPFFLSPN